jgi:hypothetical protein
MSKSKNGKDRCRGYVKEKRNPNLIKVANVARKILPANKKPPKDQGDK